MELNIWNGEDDYLNLRARAWHFPFSYVKNRSHSYERRAGRDPIAIFTKGRDARAVAQAREFSMEQHCPPRKSVPKTDILSNHLARFWDRVDWKQTT